MRTPFETSISKPRVLIIDDNAAFTHRARQLLQHTRHYVVCEENDSRSALETARSFRPDLILLDVIMPELDGTEVAAQITSDWMLHRVPIVFVTALITREEARDGRRIEGHRIVPKPIDSSELIKVVEENLPQRFNNPSRRPLKPNGSWIRTRKTGDVHPLRSSRGKQMFAIVSPPRGTANNGRSIRNILIFDSHPASRRVVREFDLAPPQPNLPQYFVLTVLIIFALAIGIFWIA